MGRVEELMVLKLPSLTRNPYSGLLHTTSTPQDAIQRQHAPHHHRYLHQRSHTRPRYLGSAPRRPEEEGQTRPTTHTDRREETSNYGRRSQMSGLPGDVYEASACGEAYAFS